MALSEKLMNILACPTCHGALDYRGTEEKLLCQSCQMDFPVVEGIPLLQVNQPETMECGCNK